MLCEKKAKIDVCRAIRNVTLPACAGLRRLGKSWAEIVVCLHPLRKDTPAHLSLAYILDTSVVTNRCLVLKELIITIITIQTPYVRRAQCTAYGGSSAKATAPRHVHARTAPIGHST
jgi:hypothetical protein